ncbi:MAG TPA: SCO family protein [Bryobacteraceae bacterium]|jgi:protein SCO1/2|nr:SCO family protein [Bryobacteraceae bacterium]
MTRQTKIRRFSRAATARERFSILLGLLLISTLSPAANRAFLPPNLQGIGIEQKLNAAVPLDTIFRDESGAQVPLRAFFGDKPVILAPVYYRCPQLCSVILRGVVAGLRPLSLKPGRDFNIVAISFNPVETPQDAAEKRAYYSKSYSSRAGMAGWHFLVGSQPSIQPVMNAIGFHYRWDPVNKMFIHASGIMVLTPEGRIARYLYGVEFEPKDLKLSLVEASHNRIGSAVDQILLFCYHYDPKTGKYSAMVLRLLHIAAVGTLVVMGLALFFLWRRDLRRQFKQSRDRGVQGTPASAREGAALQERSL